MTYSYFPISALTHYVQITLGESFTPLLWQGTKTIPLYLQSAYAFYVGEIRDYPCLFAVDLGEANRTPLQIHRDIEKLSDHWNDGIIYVSKTLSSVDRSRLVTAKVPFIVPGKQLYLPFLAIDFREIFKKVHPATERLSPAAQVLILQKLLRPDTKRMNPTELAVLSSYSKMTMTRALDELESIGVAERTRIGKRRELAFSKEGFELWNAVLPFLSSPVRKRIYVQTQGEIFANLPESGETALARYSSIDFPRHAVYALKVGSSDAEEFLLHCVDDQDIEQEYAEIELWAYDPHLLSRGETVDMLSLFLTLRASTDERIQKALSEMMESIKW